ncbi:hypothetical protein SAMN05421774_102766 [Gemmobacter megaterium]|uniref:DUF1150 family protein n=1 Tax=Gemmobacter megaterium TaxID=1086013 RepID=A0A1N7ML36_9RHOB|nr:DUF1150 family protein [Gemmobacter megaterium]GGE06263.1 hypothetical protein GCM10011345_09730 [Gemmobacter megaterium]SIS86649.1 hypothetical protein SAMN05421774_102766 [Gemmobacter megaterium]
MDHPFNFGPDVADRIVYVRPVAVAELPEALRQQATGLDIIYSVNRPDGERLALVRDRQLAFALARQNDLSPVSAH